MKAADLIPIPNQRMAMGIQARVEWDERLQRAAGSSPEASATRPSKAPREWPAETQRHIPEPHVKAVEEMIVQKMPRRHSDDQEILEAQDDLNGRWKLVRRDYSDGRQSLPSEDDNDGNDEMFPFHL